MVSPVLTYLSNSVLAGSRVKEIWATLLYYDYHSGHHSIPKINWGSFQGWGSFRAVGIISGAVRSLENDIHSPSRLFLEGLIVVYTSLGSLLLL